MNFGMAAMVEDLVGLVQNLTEEVISGRVRVRALLEIMEEKGLLAPGEFDERAAAIWERDYDELSRELMGQNDQTACYPEDALVGPENEDQSD